MHAGIQAIQAGVDHKAGEELGMMALTGEPQETTAAPRTTGEPRVVWTAADASRRTPRPRLVRKPSAICLEWLNREELMVHQQAAIRHACGVNPPPFLTPAGVPAGMRHACEGAPPRVAAAAAG